MDKVLTPLLFIFALSWASFSEGVSSAATPEESGSDGEESLKKLTTCPDPEKILPCTCQSWTYADKTPKNRTDHWAWIKTYGYVQLTCGGPQVTQVNIDNLFNLITTNSNPDFPLRDDVLLSYSFTLNQTTLTQLDLTSLLQVTVNISSVNLQNNRQLSKIVGPTSSNNNMFSKIARLYIRNCPLKDEDVEKLLKHCDPNHLLTVDLVNTLVEGPAAKIQGTTTTTTSSECPPQPVDFLKGLSSFRRLAIIGLNGNQIRELRCGPFANMFALNTLNIEEATLEKIGENGLLFHNPTEEDELELTSLWTFYNGSTIYVYIRNSSLDENGIAVNSGLEKPIRKRVSLTLRGNKFRTLPQAVFENFARKRDNYLIVKEESMVCDDKIDWLSSPKPTTTTAEEAENRKLSAVAVGVRYYCNRSSSSPKPTSGQ